MRFFRRRSSPALATLLALAMQVALVLAQTHVHPHPAADAWLAASSGTTPIACRAIVPPAGCGPSLPGDHHDDCPICRTLAAAAAGILSTPPAVAIVRRPISSPRLAQASFALPVAAAADFQARAPPLG